MFQFHMLEKARNLRNDVSECKSHEVEYFKVVFHSFGAWFLILVNWMSSLGSRVFAIKHEIQKEKNYEDRP